MDCRHLEQTDLEQLSCVEQLCFEDAYSDKLLLQQLAGRNRFSLGLFQAELEGFALFSLVVDEAELLQIAILPQCRGQGFAEVLLQRAIAELRQRSVVKVLLEVRESNEAAIRLYEKAGFVLQGRRKGYYKAINAVSAKEDALLMALDLVTA